MKAEPVNLSSRFVLVSWCKTSKCHAHIYTLFRGTEAECNERREQTNFPESLGVFPVDRIPTDY